MIEIISALVAIGAFTFTVATYIASRRQNRINQADQLLFQINNLVLKYPDIISGSEERKAAYAAIVWNFMESVYFRKLQNEKYLQPAMKQLVKMYWQWFEKNENLYDHNFVSFIKNRLAKDLGLI